MINGTLHYVTGYTGFSGDPEEQEGNYLALHFEAEGATSISVHAIGSERAPVTLDEDGILILRVREIVTGIEVFTVIDGVTYRNLLTFGSLIKEPKDE
ncbi:MAG: hypothetical protein IKF99_08375 [Oscillospiraceae bacterium]|nr:hypothetical protein [Oscillospiraceae bacterium]MBR3238435.1 hypothetical protein [Oscillospiraceae bacterium]